MFHNGVYHLKKNIVFIDVTLNIMFLKRVNRFRVSGVF
jgi:hypothetical protein